METLFLFLLLMGVAWWLSRQGSATQRDVEDLRQRVARQQRDIEELRASGRAPRAAPKEAGSSLAGELLVRRQTPSPTVPPRIDPAVGERKPVPASAAAPRPGPSVAEVLKPVVSAAPASPPSAAAPAKPRVDWEQFLGVKLFAWVGGFALFLAAAFFVKYSFDNNLIPAAMRVAIGFASGLGLLVGGVVLRKKDYQVTSQTLCATGVVILYSTCFACHSFYDFTGVTTTFAMMALVTAVAFLLAVRMDARVIAVLGLVGGFLTPPMLSSGVDRSLALFSYILLLDVGLLAITFRKRWHFLALLGAIGTALTELAWFLSFMAPGKTGTLLATVTVFNLLFLAAFWHAARGKPVDRLLTVGAALLPLLTFGFSFGVVAESFVRARPVWFFTLVFLADLCWLAMAFRRTGLRLLLAAGGGLTFTLLAGWGAMQVREVNLTWTLVAFLLFGLLHGVAPVLLEMREPKPRSAVWANLFPGLTLLLFLLPIGQNLGLSWSLWFGFFLVGILGVLLALITGSLPGMLASTLVAFGALAFHAITLPRDLAGTGGAGGAVILIGLFGLLFLTGSLVGQWWKRSNRAPGARTALDEIAVPQLSGFMPFMLLGLVTLRLPLQSPHAVFAVTLLLAVVILGAARLVRDKGLNLVALGGVLLVQLAWHAGRFTADAAVAPLIWNLLFAALFLGWPLLAWRSANTPAVPWAAGALGLMTHFFLVVDTVHRAWPMAHPGILPALFVIPAGGVLWFILRDFLSTAPARPALLAWFGGAVLFFVTLIFPIEFERQWLTLGWALEGVALLWLFHRVPHPGLRGTGVALLLLVLVRLLHPSALVYVERSGTPVFNWVLYTYGLAALAMFVAGRLLRPPREQVLGTNVQPFLYGAGTALAFALVNLEIADYFSAGARIELQFTGSFARDMSYSIAWALFAITLVAVGVWKRQKVVRYAGMGLLVITLAKLFLRDLMVLSAPYRIGAFFGVAVVAILASVLYQRFFATTAKLQSDAAVTAVDAPPPSSESRRPD